MKHGFVEWRSKSLLRLDEVAEVFRVTTRTVYRWIDEGKIQVRLTPGGQQRIAREEVLKKL